MGQPHQSQLDYDLLRMCCECQQLQALERWDSGARWQRPLTGATAGYGRQRQRADGDEEDDGACMPVATQLLLHSGRT